MLLKEFHAMSSKKEIVTYKVSVKELGLRLDQFLSKNIKNLSRSRIKTLINDNNVIKINEKEKIVIEDPSKKVKTGERYLINIPKPVNPKPKPQKIPLEILYEDNDLIVINKPVGLVVHPAPGNYENTLVNALIAHCGHSLSGISGEKKPGIVHRLDKETTGLLLIAKNSNYAKYFSLLFKQKKINKFYIALCEGIPKNDFSQVNLQIRNKKQKLENTLTKYKLIYKKNGLSQILYNPRTGKTHQLRIVSKNLGCPIIGDKKYNNSSKFKKEKLMLHAYILKFRIENKNFEFVADFPDHFLSFLKINKLNKNNNFQKA